ncbi:response regulator transcription factor [Cellulomonas sp. C5510]|uniref:response regulator transcription factor n=1 Tax=Cellulomonas sp. C5510 TaxID=2871170 RepID=UPI001C96BBD4|nr:response regulator transcription factor [Cellulomonas sp. C5510]QZN87056.1 response regulator transcription factor [Cellulomonas sp. C5510]
MTNGHEWRDSTSEHERLRALVVEDETDLAAAVADYLRMDGYDVMIVRDGARAVEATRTSAPHVVILDLGLPSLDGIEVCRRLREFSDAYVLILTARADEAEVLRGLEAGADDYVTKPFRPRELLARVRALLRRSRTPGQLPPMPNQVGDLVVDPAARRVTLAGELVDLTPTEFDLLTILLSRPTEALSRRALIEALRGSNWYGDESLVDVHVLHLRRKLGDDAATQRFVRTVRGIGYQMGEG